MFCLYNAYGYGAIDSDSAVTHHWHIEDMQKDSDDSDTMVAAKAVGRVATWQHTIPGIQEDVSNGAVAAYELTAAALIMSRRRR